MAISEASPSGSSSEGEGSKRENECCAAILTFTCFEFSLQLAVYTLTVHT